MVALNHWCAVILNCTLAADPGSSIIILIVNEQSYCTVLHTRYLYLYIILLQYQYVRISKVAIAMHYTLQSIYIIYIYTSTCTVLYIFNRLKYT